MAEQEPNAWVEEQRREKLRTAVVRHVDAEAEDETQATDEVYGNQSNGNEASDG